MGLLNTSCYLGGSAVIIISVMGGISTGGNNTPPNTNTEAYDQGAGLAVMSSPPVGPGYDPANLPPGSGPTPWMDSAGNFLGFRESGTNRGSQVDAWNLAYGGSLGDPWCATFVNAMLDSNGIQGTGSASSQSFRNWGTDAGGPVTGSLVVFRYTAGSGHVGFVHSVNPNGTINVLGGNQSQGVTISQFSTSQVVGYRLPPGTSGGGINTGGGGFGDGGGIENTR